ncbi:MAG TPA: sialate O-acetylesterase [Candidatus Methylacidiphilales bacterium]
MNRSTFLTFLSLTVIELLSPALADVRLPKIFGSNMVLQQEKPIVVWGWDAPGTMVSLKLGDQSVQVTANGQGEWKAALPAMSADGKTYALTVQGTSSVTFDNILVGEVWLASGQSNMEFPLAATLNGKADVAAADYPNIRIIRAEKKVDPKPQPDINSDAAWHICSPTTVTLTGEPFFFGFSGVAYFFGRELYNHLNVPIGLIESSEGGSIIEAWTPPEAFAAAPSVYEKKPERMWPPPSQLYNGMIHPLAPISVRGMIWYQGESNNTDGAAYKDKMKNLVDSWRKSWGDDFPFYFVQIGALDLPKNSPTALPELWEAQAAAAREIPNSGMVVINDISRSHGDTGGLVLHPPDKLEVGKRLALLALANTYGQKNLVASGPTFQSMTLADAEIHVTFDQVGGGLVSRDNKPLTDFEIIDADQGGFVPATAVISGSTVVLTAPSVSKPVAMRFAWTNTATPNLMNKEGLPAGAFRAGNVPERLAPKN